MQFPISSVNSKRPLSSLVLFPVLTATYLVDGPGPSTLVGDVFQALEDNAKRSLAPLRPAQPSPAQPSPAQPSPAQPSVSSNSHPGSSTGYTLHPLKPTQPSRLPISPIQASSAGYPLAPLRPAQPSPAGYPLAPFRPAQPVTH
ncbi:hypothetical protein CHS0354_019705 [Potamilus streckersoni]|uniref:Uncharacterized protein n=1 Tax=Potamilus streckersoni TaxID=2493646 RepID=A0AAE0VSS7_9BIVA|nr:hypothetical protein CHS0354_019705 [Potamilus streckersoni]